MTGQISTDLLLGLFLFQSLIIFVLGGVVVWLILSYNNHRGALSRVLIRLIKQTNDLSDNQANIALQQNQLIQIVSALGRFSLPKIKSPFDKPKIITKKRNKKGNVTPLFDHISIPSTQESVEKEDIQEKTTDTSEGEPTDK